MTLDEAPFPISAPPEYVPTGPLESSPGGGYRDPEIRREALAAVLSGVETGAWDEEFLDWLARLDDSTCRTVASLLWRERMAGRAEGAQPPEGTVTWWGVRYSMSAEPQRYYDEQTAREAARQVRQLAPGEMADVMCRQVGPWTEAR